MQALLGGILWLVAAGGAPAGVGGQIAFASDKFDGFHFYGGVELYAWCRSKNPLDRRACESYVCGVLDAWSTQYLFTGTRPYPYCLPAGASCGQLGDLVLQRLEESPVERQASGSSAVGYALFKKFPCQTSN